MKKNIKNRAKKNRQIFSNKNIIIVNKTNQNIHLQLFSFIKNKIITSCSSTEKFIKNIILKKKKKLNSFYSCHTLGKILALKLYAIKEKVIFDRSGFKFHGKVKEIFNSFTFFLKKK
ncbi:uL18 family ribosomal protein [Candidatus Vidania fulgoroideae]|nr:uL18 family ribosomal protein [Candidatus Vidania fulgoroideae]